MIDRIDKDVKTAMKSGDAVRRDALRLVLSSLRDAEKDARRPLTDEEVQTVLRRELKRRREAAQAFHDAGHAERAAAEESEAALIEGYLPAQLSDDDLEVDRRERDRQGRRQGPEGHGPGHARGDGARGRPGRRQARAGTRARPPRRVEASRARSRGYHGGVATLTFPIDNALAQELGADRDRLLEAVAERAGARVSLRGNEVIAEGSDAAVAQVRLLLEELAGLVEQGLPVGQQTVDAVVGVLDAHGRARSTSCTTSCGATAARRSRRRRSTRSATSMRSAARP